MTSAPGEARHRVLHALKIRGLLDTRSLATVAGLDEARVGEVAATLAEAGLAVHREGRMEGYLLTPEGREEYERLLTAEREQADLTALERADERFVEVNEPFKRMCTAWQETAEAERRRDDVTDQLRRIHDQALEAVALAEQGLDRYGVYRERLESAFSRFGDGDDSALLRPLSESYHDVWMELHHDLLLTIGRERSEADGH